MALRNWNTNCIIIQHVRFQLRSNEATLVHLLVPSSIDIGSGLPPDEKSTVLQQLTWMLDAGLQEAMITSEKILDCDLGSLWTKKASLDADTDLLSMHFFHGPLPL